MLVLLHGTAPTGLAPLHPSCHTKAEEHRVSSQKAVEEQPK